MRNIIAAAIAATVALSPLATSAKPRQPKAEAPIGHVATRQELSTGLTLGHAVEAKGCLPVVHVFMDGIIAKMQARKIEPTQTELFAAIDYRDTAHKVLKAGGSSDDDICTIFAQIVLNVQMDFDTGLSSLNLTALPNLR